MFSDLKALSRGWLLDKIVSTSASQKKIFQLVVPRVPCPFFWRNMVIVGYPLAE